MIRTLEEQRKKLLADLHALRNQTLTDETRAKMDAMLTDAQRLKSDIERLKAVEAEERSLSERIEHNAPPRGAVESADVDNRSQEERAHATNEAFRAYMRGEQFEQRDLSVAANGSVLLPVGAVAPINAGRSAGSIYDIVSVLRTSTGDDIRFPLADDTGNSAVLDSTAVGAGTDPSVTGVTIGTDGLRLGDPLLVDNKLIQDAIFDIIGWVSGQFQSRYMRSVASLISTGNASKFAALNTAVPVGVTTAAAGVIAYDDLNNLVGSLDPFYLGNACFSMSNATLTKIRGIKDTQARPLFLNFNDGATSGFVGTLLGYPVKLNQYAPAVATNAKAIVFGDHAAGYTLREVVPGLTVVRTTERYIELNRTAMIGFARAGGAPTLANNTIYSPLQSLKIQ